MTKRIFSAFLALLFLALYGCGGSSGSSSTATTTAIATNTAPVLDTIGDQSIGEGTLLAFIATASDADGDGYSFTITGLPAGAMIDSATGEFTLTPGYEEEGAYTVTVTVTDDDATNPLSTSETINITIINTNRAPLLFPIGDQSVAEGNLLSFTATATDADSNGYTFSGTDLPMGAAIASDTGVFTWTPGFAEDGVYTVTITVTDDDATGPLASFEIVTITVANTNRAPVLDPIGDKAVDEGNLLSFTATATDDDSDGYSFTMTGNLPAGAMIDSATGDFTWTPGFEEAGIYSATITVTDDDASPLDDSETITINVANVNSPPIADAGPLQSTQTGALVTLDGSASYDMDGDSLAYSWVIDSGAGLNPATLSDTTAARPTFIADLDGDYQFTLTVTDDLGATGSDTVMVTASSANAAPTADAGPDQSASVDELVTLDGSASSDVDGDLINFAWSIFPPLPDGSSVTLTKPGAAQPTFTPDAAGTYIFTLIVTDEHGLASVADMVTITASAIDENLQPIADAGPDQYVQSTALVTLDGSGSSDDVAVTVYTWNMVSIPAGSAALLDDPALTTPTFTADLPGDYIFSLMVNDGEFDSLVPDTVVINAAAADINTPPVADAGPDQLITDFETTVILTGSGTDGDGDAITAYSWTLVSAPATSGGPAALNISSLVTQTLTFDPDKDGSYVFTLVVYDDLDWSLADTVVVTVSFVNGDYAGANIVGEDFSNMDLTGANFSDANALSTDFTGSTLIGTNLTDANLNSANLTGATLIGVILTDTNVNKATFVGATLEYLDFTAVFAIGQNDFSYALLTDVNLSGLPLTVSTFAYAVFVNVDLSGADLTGSDLTGVDLSTTDYTGVIWFNTTCPDGTLSSGTPEACVGDQLTPLVP